MKFLKIAVLLFLPASCLFAQTNTDALQQVLPEEKRIFVYSQSTDKKTQAAKADKSKENKLEEIFYVVRMPSSWNEAKDAEARKKKSFSVRGVLAVCTWHREEESLRNIVSGTDNRDHYEYFVKFADENNLALISWSNFGGYNISVSADEMTKEQSKYWDKVFSDRLSEWERGFKRVLHKYNLPKNSIMISAVSGGAQIAHRIAFRKPQYFSGIHIHVNSSYDTPTASAKNMLWLVTTGELEYGYPAAERFYKKMLDLDYCVMFKAGENLGHARNKQIIDLGLEFFRYLLTFVPDPSDPNWKAPPVDKFYMVKHPIYIGDYLNQVAYPTETALKHVADRKYMVPLPTKPMAERWGTIIEK